MHGDAASIAGDELVKIKVNIAVADAAPVPRPPHLHVKTEGTLRGLICRESHNLPAKCRMQVALRWN